MLPLGRLKSALVNLRSHSELTLIYDSTSKAVFSGSVSASVSTHLKKMILDENAACSYPTNGFPADPYIIAHCMRETWSAFRIFKPHLSKNSCPFQTLKNRLVRIAP